MHRATFFLSTGRCGTQWLTRWLTDQYSDYVHVEHEPLQHQYQSRYLLAEQAQFNSDNVLKHLETIDQVLQEKPYIEVGHPCWGAISHLVDYFQERIRIVHLIRHPITTSFSWVTHGAYQKPLLPYLPEKIPLSPFDEGVQFPEYQERWATLSEFEKNLYYWTEVNSLGIQLEKSVSVPWLRIRYEDLFYGDDLNRLVDFLNLPKPPQVALQSKQTVIDKYHYVTNLWDDWKIASQHSACVQLSELLGYPLDAVDDQALEKRYLGY